MGENVMKKLGIAIAAFALILSSASAYNPPELSEGLYTFSSTRNLAGQNSVAGGGSLGICPDSIVVNPALTAQAQRVALNIGYTALIASEGDSEFGNAFQAGILIPFKMFNFSGLVNGTMVPLLKDSVNFKAGLAKEITPKLSVGADADVGIAWGAGADFAVGAGLGFVYDVGALGFMKDFSFGASIINLGKYYKNEINGTKGSEGVTSWPSLATLKAGVSATFVKNDTIDFGASIDVSVPTFQNAIFDVTPKFAIKEMLYFTVPFSLNCYEMAEGHKGGFSAGIGAFFKFTFNVKNNQYLERNGWSESEMIASAAYKNLDGYVHAASANLDVTLGMKDKTPPVIKIWPDNEEDDD
jgi:hypothetical protein